MAIYVFWAGSDLPLLLKVCMFQQTVKHKKLLGDIKILKDEGPAGAIIVCRACK